MGAVVAIEPATGAILAMSSQPSYDPNRLASHDLVAVQDAWKSLNADKNKPMLNRATRSALPPGSYTLTNSGGGTCGGNEITLQQALSVSCNVSFGWLGLKVGQESLAAKATSFGFEKKPFTDLSSYASTFTAKNTELEPPQLAQSAIGQFEVRATPLQMAPNLQVIENIEPEQVDEAMTPADANELTTMMVATVDSGTGRPARIPGVKVAGKTGTAQSAPDRPAYAWFVGFAPADNPQVAVAVLVESTKDTGDIGGGRLGGPIARAVMEAALR